ncbi:hypothetical protein [Brevundimonas sp.]|uniref:hypothetical protein n=1 Tax=Brevundimonas sp. TaxID=1871086 RepID=UPI002731EC1E|nr:hypothetical protein [Brevundimonas sp.]MDP1912445.1 hypothetical protein [Brevundimonas sp.]
MLDRLAAARALGRDALGVLTAETNEWSSALERVRVSGQRVPVEMDEATIAAVAKWASTSKVNADRAERWAWQVGEVIGEWSGDDEDDDRLDLLRSVEGISDYWDVEH